MPTVTNDPTSTGTTAWTNPTYAYLDDTNKATAVMAAKNTSIAGIWGSFGFTDPGGGAVITKVEIGTQHYLSTAASIIATMGRQLSWDGGTNWTTESVMDELTTEVTVETATIWVDVTNGRSWTWSELSDTYLQARIICYQGNDSTGFTMYLDVVFVRVTYGYTTSLSKTSDVRFRTTTSLSKNSDVRFRRTELVQKSSDVRFRRTELLSKTSDVEFIVGAVTYTLSKNSDVRFRRTETLSKTSAVDFRRTETISKSSDVRFRRTELLSKTSDTRFRRTEVIAKASDVEFSEAGGPAADNKMTSGGSGSASKESGGPGAVSLD